MDGDGFDVWGSQLSASGPGHAPEPGSGFDLNSQAPASEGFPGLGLYGAILHGDDHQLLPGRARGVGLPPYRPPRSGSGDGRAPRDPTFSEVHPNLENPAFWPHFNDCIGAIDGTHVKLVVDKSKRIPYLNRHNETSQNVLAVCDFDMRFTFVLSGWPGSAHDMRVFKDAVTTYQHKFPHPPPGKYYVVDAGYPNRSGFLSPYRCTRYHVEQWHNGPPPQGMQETFNHAHAKVRNVIERSFGVLKMKFRMLLNMPNFPEKKQARIIVACMALHNFIRESGIADREFDACDADENYNPMPSFSASAWPEDEPLVEDVNMNAFRDELADALFHGGTI